MVQNRLIRGSGLIARGQSRNYGQVLALVAQVEIRGGLI